jgi:hypothetical protein
MGTSKIGRLFRNFYDRSPQEFPETQSGNPCECDLVKVELQADYRYLQEDSIVTKII